MDAFSKIVMTLYSKNQIFFIRKAKFVLSNFYYVPLEVDDLVSNCLQELIKIARNFDGKNGRKLEEYLFSSTKYIMYTYCRFYANKNNGILNNYVDFDLIENMQATSYNIKDLSIDYLSRFQKKIVNDLYNCDMPLKLVAIKYNRTSFAINKEIKKIRLIIQEKLDNSIN